jgi:transposase-like protein
MAAKDNQRKVAAGMFIEQGLTSKAIAELIQVSEQTLSKWRKEDNWEARRDEALAAPHKIREMLLRELKLVADGEKPTIDADALAKISKVLDSLSDKISPQSVISVLKTFDNWMADNDPHLAVQFLDWHKRFIQHIISQHAE